MPLILKGVIVAMLAATAEDVHWIVCNSSDSKEVLANGHNRTVGRSCLEAQKKTPPKRGP